MDKRSASTIPDFHPSIQPGLLIPTQRRRSATARHPQCTVIERHSLSMASPDPLLLA
ncbi:MAG: hypothetical protein AB7I68_14810 [Porticoccaceae bacterium]